MFENIIGNDKLKNTLQEAVKTNRISHSYLFVGISGIGKKLIAKEFAKMLLCLNENQYCNTCKSCIEFDTNNNPDFFLINEQNETVKIEQIRQMQKTTIEKPIVSSRKVYIIDNSDKMTTEAQNCLLKTLEEPPEYVTIILIGTNENAFLNTIKSRCTIMRFTEISKENIKKYLQENYKTETINDNILDIAGRKYRKSNSFKR